MQFILSLHDGLENPVLGPIFTFAKKRKVKNLIAFPDFEMIKGYQSLNKIIYMGNQAFSYESKENKAFWRGATTGGVFSPENWHSFPRSKMTLLSKKHPNLLNAKFSTVTDHIEPLTSIFNEEQIFSATIPIYDHLRYKFLIDVDGHSCTYSRLYWILLSNSVCLKQVTENEQWYYGGIKPYIHYIPIKSDMSDLIEKINWALDHSYECKEIAKNSTQFVENNLQKKNVYQYVYLLLNAYANLMKVN